MPTKPVIRISEKDFCLLINAIDSLQRDEAKHLCKPAIEVKLLRILHRLPETATSLFHEDLDVKVYKENLKDDQPWDFQDAINYIETEVSFKNN